MPGNGTARRVNQRSGYEVRYRVEGTAAYAPERAVRESVRVPAETGRRKKKNTLMISPGYVIFLALISSATVLMCVHYVRLKATITAQLSENRKLEDTLMSVRSENDALLENVSNALDWNHIKDVAINEMGMKYATEEQIVWYNTDESCYIRQYAELPRS